MLACGAGEANTAIGKRMGLTGGVVALLRFYGSARTIPFQDDLRTLAGLELRRLPTRSKSCQSSPAKASHRASEGQFGAVSGVNRLPPPPGGAGGLKKWWNALLSLVLGEGLSMHPVSFAHPTRPHPWASRISLTDCSALLLLNIRAVLIDRQVDVAAQ